MSSSRAGTHPSYQEQAAPLRITAELLPMIHRNKKMNKTYTGGAGEALQLRPSSHPRTLMAFNVA